MKHLVAIACCLLAARALAADIERPNLIVVLSDDVGLSRVGCYGGGPFLTPNLDRMAATGLKFERCYSMPLCGPSRSALLCGKYPFRTGATTNNNSAIDPGRHRTIANVLREAGYATCAVGKLGQSAGEDDPAAPGRLGFDESMLWMGRGTPDRYWHPRYYRNGEVFQGTPEEYGPDKTHEFLVDFMDRHRDEPFFVYYSAVLTHVPIVPTPDSAPGESDPRQLVIDMVSYLDKQMGLLMDDLDRLGLRDDTIILFTSDNGPYGNPLGTVDGKPIQGVKGDLLEGGVREPLIVNCPKRVTPGRVSGDLVDFTDFFPTVLDLAGVGVPEGLTLDGRSFAPQVLGEKGAAREWVYAQVGREHFIADSRFKLYGDGRFVDITESPVAEKPVPEGDAEGIEAKGRLAMALAKLRAGIPDSPDAGPSGAGLKPPPLTPEQWKADLALLTERKVIDDPTPWVELKGDLDGAEVAALIQRAAGIFEPVNGAGQAIAVFQREGILNSPAYWTEHAREGRQCNAGNVTRLLQKLAMRLRAR
ncbi:MAG: sulfatase-like hydrolase/transferase [Verrucomicrobiae bacterium]|nr:sulfatase-like hydrolase/transferase [Verrucomicrobiae bacterium]